MDNAAVAGPRPMGGRLSVFSRAAGHRGRRRAGARRPPRRCRRRRRGFAPHPASGAPRRCRRPTAARRWAASLSRSTAMAGGAFGTPGQPTEPARRKPLHPVAAGRSSGATKITGDAECTSAAARAARRSSLRTDRLRRRRDARPRRRSRSRSERSTPYWRAGAARRTRSPLDERASKRATRRPGPSREAFGGDRPRRQARARGLREGRGASLRYVKAKLPDRRVPGARGYQPCQHQRRRWGVQM